MTEKPTRRRRRLLLVPLLGVGVAAWAVRSRFVERRALREGWQPLPPRPIRHPTPVEPAPAEATPGILEEPVSAEQLELAVPEPESEPVATEPVATEPVATGPAAVHARAVPAAAAVATVVAPVTAPALPDAPFGSGSVRANADGSSPDAEYVVKGKTATRVFYAPGSPYYARTRADVWFRTDDDARAAGFAPRAPRRGSAT